MRIPVVIGHRGAPGYRPEHTLSSYRLAIALGADAVEPDLVMTADGVVVVRHENEIGASTDVASRPEFAGRRTTKRVDGVELTGWFTEDFTLVELKSLRAVEPLPHRRPRNTAWDGRYEVATFDELLLLIAEEQRRWGRRVGVVVELKSSAYFRSVGLDLESAVLASLGDHGLDHRDSGVILESFETTNLRDLSRRTDLPLVQLVHDTGAPADLAAAGDPTTYDDLCTPAGMRAIAQYADGISLAKSLLLTRPGLAHSAHLAGLEVFCYTIRDDDPVGRGGVEAEVRLLLDAGVDGLFTDHPDTTVLVRDDWAAQRVSPRAAALPRPA